MPGITVEEVWRQVLPPQVTLAGGAEGLSRAVTGTATMRARTPAFPPFHGGELALISLRLLAQVEPQLRPERLVGQLADARVAGIVLLDVDLDSELVGAAGNAAEAHGVPVLVCPTGHSTEEIDVALHRYMSGVREALLRRAQEVQQEFTALVFAGHGLPAIVDRLAGVTGMPAVWEDRDLELRAWHVPPAAASEVQALISTSEDLPGALRGARLPLLRWAKELPVTGHAPEVTVLPLRADAASSVALWKRLVVPFSAGGEVGGYLSLLGRNGAITQEARLALAGAGLAASIEALRMRTVAETQGKATTSVVRDWVTGRFRSVDELAAHLEQLGHSAAPPYAVALLEGSVSAEVASRVAKTLAPAGTLATAPMTGVMDGMRTVVVVPSIDLEALTGAAATIHVVLAAAHDSRAGAGASGADATFAGIGRAAESIEDVPRAYRDALQALAIARRLGGRHRVAFFGTLGVYRLLAAVSPEHELRSVYEDALGPLLAHDRKNGGELLRTLDAYLQSGGSVVETAERLHTHRNTVLYRIDRINDVLGTDARQPEQRLLLHLALRAGEVLGVAEDGSASSSATSAASANGRPKPTLKLLA